MLRNTTQQQYNSALKAWTWQHESKKKVIESVWTDFQIRMLTLGSVPIYWRPHWDVYWLDGQRQHHPVFHVTESKKNVAEIFDLNRTTHKCKVVHMIQALYSCSVNYIYFCIFDSFAVILRNVTWMCTVGIKDVVVALVNRHQEAILCSKLK